MKRSKIDWGYVVYWIVAVVTIVVVVVGLYFLGRGVLAKLAGNLDILDTVYKFDYAQLIMPDGTIVSGNVESWTDYEDADQIQVTIDGVTYLTHAENVVLIAR